ncbi:hypothetical protein FA95DRAFT_627153 [Auriscalpium vulgare]|uniref:Uncharacterized protein n=1 Tax=Auriscalpium vulgare TaxID=40419 RepID=A0ACB8RDG3_9AGAM|nr:hypothetical protein FA95DRAFT_627153 [Auriscalpium vulgare]
MTPLLESRPKYKTVSTQASHSVPSTMFSSLPVEIQLMVLNEISSINDILRVRTVNKALRNAASALAFRTVGATNRDHSALNLVSLLESDLAQYVREVVYRDIAAEGEGRAGKPSSTPSPGALPDYGLAVESTLVYALLLAARLPRLTTLRLIFHPELPEARCNKFGNVHLHKCDACAPLHLQCALLTTLETSAPRLRALTLVNLTPMLNDLSMLDVHMLHGSGFSQVFTSVEHLRIGTASWGTESLPHLFWWAVVSRYVLPNLLESVTSLTLVGDGPSICAAIAWEKVALPRLQYLALEGVDVASVWGGDEREKFVNRHPMLECIDMGCGEDRARWTRNADVQGWDAS